MADRPKILALDIATRTGWAYGPAGKIERSGTINLRPGKDDDYHVAWNNLGFFLVNTLAMDTPDVIACEAAMQPQHQRGGAQTIISWGCLAVVRFIAECRHIPVRYVQNNTMRKHYIGKGYVREVPSDFKPSLRSIEERRRLFGKSQMVQRARVMGHIPIDSNDDNRADACGIHSYASEAWFRVPPLNLVLFGASA